MINVIFILCLRVIRLGYIFENSNGKSLLVKYFTRDSSS